MSRTAVVRRLTSAVERFARRAGITVHRWPANRFNAMDDLLLMLQLRGYRPKTIIDVGANVGSWSDLARAIFPEARFHLIEPQPACAEDLHRFAAPQCRVHNVVVTGPGASSVRMTGVGTTGASVMKQEQSKSDAMYPATTLDELLSNDVNLADRALLKLDVEGHELEVLRGASSVLSKVEVVVCEVRFFDIESSGRPVFFEIAKFLEGHSFQLHDIAALGSRRRDQRLNQGDVVFVRKDSPLMLDNRWA